MRLPTEPGPGVALLLPEHWEQLARWLPLLERAFPGYSWLIRSEQRIAGMFLSQLQRRPYVLLSPQTTLMDLKNSLKSLAYRQSKPLKPAEAFPTVLTVSVPGQPAAFLTTRELECGFAISLGLSNRQIAQALHVSEEAIKSHVNSLLHKLRLEGREELADYIDHLIE